MSSLSRGQGSRAGSRGPDTGNTAADTTSSSREGPEARKHGHTKKQSREGAMAPRTKQNLEAKRPSLKKV